MIALIDGNNLLQRAIHAARKSNTMSVDEVETGSLYLFISMLVKYVRLVRPDSLLIAWDFGHQYRDDLYPDYKANRVKKTEVDPESVSPFELAHQFLDLAGVEERQIFGWEADDIIAAVVRQCSDSVAIISGDKDLLQLLEDTDQRQVIQYQVPATDPMTAQTYLDKKGWTPARAPFVQALVGDTSDNVPGLRGVGPVKALKMMQEADWDWETLLAQIGSERASEASLMLDLVNLRTLEYPAEFMDQNRGVRDFHPTEYDDTSEHSAARSLAFAEWLEHYQMKSVLEPWLGGSLWSGSEQMVEPISRSADQFETMI